MAVICSFSLSSEIFQVVGQGYDSAVNKTHRFKLANLKNLGFVGRLWALKDEHRVIEGVFLPIKIRKMYKSVIVLASLVIEEGQSFYTSLDSCLSAFWQSAEENVVMICVHHGS